MLGFEAVANRLDGDDDPDLWRAALEYVLAEVEPSPVAIVEVGRCSHWQRPHQTRWKADGGFACPIGYGDGGGGYSGSALPQFDWSVVIGWNGSAWDAVERRSIRPALRLAIPSRTRLHRQAAVHALWHTGAEKEVAYYGFRRRPEGWRCTAST